MEPFAAEKGKSNKGIQRGKKAISVHPILAITITSTLYNIYLYIFILHAVANVLASLRAKFHLGGVKKSRGG